MFWPFKKKSIENHLSASKKMRIHGMIFKIKRIDVLDHCTGAKVCSAIYDTYKVGNDVSTLENMNFDKIKSHYIDVLMAGIVSPEFSRVRGVEGKIHIENLLTDWSLASEIYGEIMAYSYGKKNFAQLTSQGKNS